MSGFWEEERDDGWRRLDARLDEKTRQFWAIDSVSNAISEAVPIGDLLRVSLERTVDVTGATGGAIYLGGAGGDWTLATAYNMPETLQQSYAALDATSPLVKATLESGRPITWDDLKDAPNHSSGLPEFGGLRVWATLAMTGAGITQAIMVLFSHEPQRFNNTHLEMLRVIGHLTGLALANTVVHKLALERADKQLERRVAELETILSSMYDGLLICDEDGRIIRANLAASKAVGLSLEQLKAQSLLSPEWNHLVEESAHGGGHSNAHSSEQEGPLARAILRGEVCRECLLQMEVAGETRVLSASTAPIKKIDSAGSGAVVVIRDVTERRRAAQLQEEYLSLLSHELRAPLTVISGYAQLLSRSLTRKGFPDEAGSADLIKEQAGRMSGMVGDLVESGKLESGMGRLELQPSDLGIIVEGTVTRIIREQRRNEDKYPITLSVEPDLPPVQADERRLDQVLTNLLTNAIRYSPGGGTISVSVERACAPAEDTEVVRVSVVDEGIGIPPEERGQIFTRTFRGKEARVISAQGLGLGLYICKLIVEAHGGAIGVAEGPGGKGSTFWFTLPARNLKK